MRSRFQDETLIPRAMLKNMNTRFGLKANRLTVRRGQARNSSLIVPQLASVEICFAVLAAPLSKLSTGDQTEISTDQDTLRLGSGSNAGQIAKIVYAEIS